MNKLFSKIAALSVGLAMAVGVGVAVGQKNYSSAKAVDEDVVIDLNFTKNTYGMNTTQGNQTLTGDAATYGFEVNGGAKISASPATSSSYFMLGKTGKYLRNTSAPENYYVSSISLTYSSGVSTNVVLSISFGEDALTSQAEGDDLHTLAKASASATVETTNTNKDNAYFLLYVTNNYNVQIKELIVTWKVKAPSKTVANVTGVHESPSQVYVGDILSTSSVTLDVVYSDETPGVVASSRVECDTSTPGNVKATAYYDDATGNKSAQFDVQVLAVEVESIEKSGTFKTEFSENQAFSFGGGKIIVNKNNGSSEIIDPTAEGVSVKIGETDITGITYYIQKSDKDKVVTISYQGKSFTYTITSVSDAVVADGYYQMITSSEDLVVDAKYVIGYVDSNKDISVLMGAQNTNNRASLAATISEGKVNDLPAGAVVFTLKAGNKSNTYSFYDGTGYLYAASGSSNHLKTEVELSDNSSFSVAVANTGLVTADAQGTNSHCRIKCNTGNNPIIFSCYTTGSTTGTLINLFKFVASERTDDQKAVDTFINTYMHLDDVDVNDHTGGNACKGEAGYYAVAKEHYASLTADQKTFFATSEEFRVARARERLAAWAVANGETFNPAEGTFTNIRLNPVNFIGGDTSGFAIIIVISTVSILAFGLAIMLRKKHR